VPPERVQAALVVDLADMRGATAIGSILLYVETCGYTFRSATAGDFPLRALVMAVENVLMFDLPPVSPVGW